MEITEAEQTIKTRFKLDDAQLLWRRQTIADMFHGDIEAFNEKYPDSPETAFRAPGDIVFNSVKNTLLKLLTAFDKGNTGRVVKAGDRVRFEPGEFGKVEIIRPPEDGHVYAMGSDVAEGLKEDEDVGLREGIERYKTYSTCVVRDFESWELCALMECQFAEDVFAEEAMLLGQFYNFALWAPEIPGPGRAVIAIAKGYKAGDEFRYRSLEVEIAPVKPRYENLYQHEYRDADDEFRVKRDYGFRNTERTKAIMETDYQAFIREEGIKIGSSRIVGQALTYIIDHKTNKHKPKRGCFSDLLFADMICIQLLKSREGISEREKMARRFMKEQELKRKKRRPMY